MTARSGFEVRDRADSPTRHRPLKRLFAAVVGYGITALFFWGIARKLATLTTSKHAFDLVTVADLGVICLVGLVSLSTNLPALVLTLPGQRWSQAAINHTAGAAVSNTVPEGGAVATGLNFAMSRSWGFTLTQITRSVLAVNVWTNLARYGLAGIALAVLATQRGESGSVAIAAAVVLVAVVSAVGLLSRLLRSESFARRIGALLTVLSRPLMRLLRRPVCPDLPDQVADLRDELVVLIKRRWHSLTVAVVVSQLAGSVTLGVALRLEHVEGVSWARIVVAYSGMGLASLVAPTPGGLGVAEGTLLAILGHGLDKAATPQLVAAVLLFRTATWVLPTVIGAGTYLYWLRTRHRGVAHDCS